MTDLTPDAFNGLDLLSSAVVVLDPDYAVHYANAAAENLLETSLRGLRQRRFPELFSFSATLQQALDNARGNNWSYTGHNVEFRCGDRAPLHLDCTVTPIGIDSGRLLLELRPIDQQLKAAREERLIEQQEANRELMRNLAHEIKNPLGGIRGAAQLLQHELRAPALKEYTQVIIEEVDRLQSLMQRMLMPHRLMKPAAINIHEVLERVRRLLLAEYPNGLSVRRDYDTSLPVMIGDFEQLIQVFLNIARNAAQAMNGSGEIVLATRAARQVTLVKRRYRLALEVQVIDNGPGIPDSLREHIFYPLVSGREGGTGLGLTLAQSFVQQHQGTIECASRPGHTCFTICLPLDSADRRLSA